MAYDEKLAGRVRRLLSRKPAFSERKMFGGLCFLLRGRMCCGVHGAELIVRVTPADQPAALAKPHVRAFDLTGRPMKGFVIVRPRGFATNSALRGWIAYGMRVTDTLPAKAAKARAGGKLNRGGGRRRAAARR